MSPFPTIRDGQFFPVTLSLVLQVGAGRKQHGPPPARFRTNAGTRGSRPGRRLVSLPAPAPAAPRRANRLRRPAARPAAAATPGPLRRGAGDAAGGPAPLRRVPPPPAHALPAVAAADGIRTA